MDVALSLDTDDFDLTAELLLTWSMPGLPWSPVAAFAFRVLAAIEDRLGFLPGLASREARAFNRSLVDKFRKELDALGQR